MSVPCARRLLLRRQREELAGRTFTVRVGGTAYVFRPPELALRSDLSAVLARAQREGGSHTLQKQLYLRGEERILRGICDELYRPSSPRAGGIYQGRGAARALCGGAAGQVRRRKGAARGGGRGARRMGERGVRAGGGGGARLHPERCARADGAPVFLHHLLQRRKRRPRPQHRPCRPQAGRRLYPCGRGAFLQRRRGRAHGAGGLCRSARHPRGRVCLRRGRGRVPGQHHPLQRRIAGGGFPPQKCTRTASPWGMCPPRATPWSAAQTAI